MLCTYLHEGIHTAEFSLEALLATFAGNLLGVITTTVEEVLEGSFRCHLFDYAVLFVRYFMGFPACLKFRVSPFLYAPVALDSTPYMRGE